jgi:hypothetical protein
METKFISEALEKDINSNVIDVMFPNLNKGHKTLLMTYLCGLIEVIATSYGFYKDKFNFTTKLRQNDYKDVKWLVLQLIPYVNQEKRSLTELTDFNELYTTRIDVVSTQDKNKSEELNVEDINIVSPKYAFSNIQYGRCFRNSEGAQSRPFDERHMRDNYYLLLDTVRITKNKTYINWIDILPFNLSNYQTTQLYEDTKRKIEKKNYVMVDMIDIYPIEKIHDINQITIMNNSIRGLNIEDIYDTISKDLYDSIVHQKWLLYEVIIAIDNKSIPTSILFVMDYVFRLNDILNGSTWDEIEKSFHELFKEAWQISLIAFEKEFTIIIDAPSISTNDEEKSIAESGGCGKILSIPFKTVEILMKSIAIFFDRGYSKINAVIKEKDDDKRDANKYVRLDTKKIINDDDFDEFYGDGRMSYVNKEDTLKTLKSIDVKYIYDFFLETMTKFKSTWYSHHMMNKDKTQILCNNAMWYTNKISYKNVYNFSKSIIRERKPLLDSKKDPSKKLESEDYVRFPERWSEMDDEMQNIFLDRLNDKTQKVIYDAKTKKIDTSNAWFDIKQNIREALKTLGIHPTNEMIANAMTNIYREIRSKITDIIFEVMICKGIMSYMVAETDLTNNDIYNMSIDEQKKSFVQQIKNTRFSGDKLDQYAANSYYYLTNKPFGENRKYLLKLGDEPDEYDYFKICSTSKLAWYTLTAFHWVAQLGFCHRFINNRINYITGGTGAGKSSQVPKLFMYYLKAIDKINNPTVILTIPRTNIAKRGVGFMSQQLALPYVEFDRVKNRDSAIRNNNQYVQFRHMGDKFGDDGFYPKIRFITDGSILHDIKDPLIKTKTYKKDKNKNDNYIYTKTDKYDVVIVDEAHEHNTNMDMILSLMRNATYYNNKLRLVIMSATMDFDEPIYRRFYRDVNDNRKYPLNRWIEKHKIDRINVERRFDISPPGEKMPYKITEIYDPNTHYIDIVRNIINDTSSGDILLFLPGRGDIEKAVAILNSTTPSNVIALPYYRDLPEHCKEFIDRIESGLSELRIDKTRTFSATRRDELTMGDYNHYTRFILAATNMAEASITINTLRFVVDSGTEKTAIYDYERRSIKQITNYITNASEKQRRGRVGRVAPGTVYHAYPKNTTELVIKQYNIATQDIHSSIMLNLLRTQHDIPIFTRFANDIVSGIGVVEMMKKLRIEYGLKKDIPYDDSSPSDVDTLLLTNNIRKVLEYDYKNLYRTHGRPELSEIDNDFIKKIIDIILDTYCVRGKLYEYYGNNDANDYNNNKYPKFTYFSGFSSDQLTDSLGIFYMIHPDELIIERNICGEVVKSLSESDLKLESIESSKCAKKMISNKMIVFWETLINSGFVDISKYDKLYRGKLGELFRYWSENFSRIEDQNLVSFMFYGFGLSNNNKEFERIMNLVVQIIYIYSNHNGYDNLLDSTILIKYLTRRDKINISNEMLDDIRKSYGENGIVKSDTDILTNIAKMIDGLFSIEGIEYNLFESSNFKKDFNGYDISNIGHNLPSFFQTTVCDLQKRKELLHSITSNHNEKLIEVANKHKDYLKHTGLDMDFINSFIKGRETTRGLLNDVTCDINNVGESAKTDIKELRTYLRKHREYMNELNIDLIKGAIMMACPYNILKKIQNTSNQYMPLYNPHYDTVMSVSTKLMDRPFYQDYVIYFKSDDESQTASTLLPIYLADLAFIANIYNINEFNRKFKESSLNSKKMHIHINNMIDNYVPVPNRYSTMTDRIMAMTNIKMTLETIKPIFESISKSKIISIMDSTGNGYERYSKFFKKNS